MNAHDFTDSVVERAIQGAVTATERGRGHVQVTEFGVNHIGEPFSIGFGGWARIDTYVSNSDRKPVEERRFCASRKDYSDMATGYNGNTYKGNIQYHSSCSCCYLGFSHTVDYHNKSIGKAKGGQS